MLALVQLLLAWVLTAPPPGPQEASLPSGAEVLAQMRAAYSGAGTYSDSGSFAVTIASSTPGQSLWSQGTFATKFVRSHGLRVEATYCFLDTAKSSNVLYSTETQHSFADWMSGRSEPKVYEFKSLEYLLGASSSVTDLRPASAQYVTSLLVANEFSNLGFAQFTEPVVEALEPLADTFCWRLSLKGPTGALVTIWVDRESHLLRRLSRDDPLGDLHRLTTIELQGLINPSISPDELKFP